MIAYTDGSCSNNPNGVGAWAYVVTTKGAVIGKRVGRDYVTTSNRMELMAILEVMKDFPDVMYILSDSQYSVNCISGKWKAKVNLDLIDPAKKIMKQKKIELSWVKGHCGNEYNEMADQLCGEEMRYAFKEKNGVDFVDYVFYRIKK